MDFIDWCNHVLEKLIEAGKDPHIDEIRLAQLLYGEEFRTAEGFHQSTHRRGMLDAVKELVNLGLIKERSGRFWTVKPEGRQFVANPSSLLQQIRATALEPDEERILHVVNALSPQGGSDPPHAWLEWVNREPLLTEYGITAGQEMQNILWPVSEDLASRGFIYRRASPGWHLDLKPTYSGLAWEKRQYPLPETEIAHVLFLDMVGFSKFSIGNQQSMAERLHGLVQSTSEYRRASEGGRLISVPTGDGMALVFFTSPEDPMNLALELARALRDDPEIRLRMGVHTGPLRKITDINGRENVAGGGINIAARVMYCGEAGHILLSQTTADILLEIGGWEDRLHDLGEAVVKHGVKIHLFSLVDTDVGNPQPPSRLTASSAATAHVQSPQPSVDVLIVWDPSVVEPDDYAALITALGDLVRAEGGIGVERIGHEGFDIPVSKGILV